MNFGDPGKRDPLILQRLLDLNLITPRHRADAGGSLEPRQIGERPVLLSEPFMAPSAPAVLTARYDNGYWVKTREACAIPASGSTLPRPRACGAPKCQDADRPGAYRIVVGMIWS